MDVYDRCRNASVFCGVYEEMLIKPVLCGIALVLFVVSCSAAFCLTRIQQPAEANTCQYSDNTYNYDASVMRLRRAPTHFRLMLTRYLMMIQSVRSYPCTGTVTVGFDGHHYLQNGRANDPGMVELMPTLSRLLGISLENTYDLTILLVVLTGLVIGYAGFWNLYPEGRARWFGVFVFLCIGVAEVVVADEYMFQICPLIAGIPWLLHFGLQRKAKALTATAVLLAFCCSWFSLVRSGSIIICMTFLLTTFITRRRMQNPFLPILLIVLACVPASLFERSLIARRDTVLAKFGEKAQSGNRHPLWHTVYIGFSFLPNSEVPEYRDEVADAKARSIDPTVVYSSPRYEAILRHEVWSLVLRRPLLVIGTLLAKAAIVLLLASIPLYPVRRLIFTEKAFFWFDAACLLTIGMSGMSLIVAVPRIPYMLALGCLALLYSSIKLCRERYPPKGPLRA